MHFGILLENKYTLYYPGRCGYQSLKGNDSNVAYVLESANQCLPEEEQYSLHVVGFDLLNGSGSYIMYGIHGVYSIALSSIDPIADWL